MIGAVVGEVEAVAEGNAGEGVVGVKVGGAVGYFDGLVVTWFFEGVVDCLFLVGVIECAVPTR